MLPSLWAFTCLLWPAGMFAVAGLLLGFVLMALADWLAPGPGTAAWMIPLRIRLSLAVIACHLAMVASLFGV